MKQKPKFDMGRRVKKRVQVGDRYINGYYMPPYLATWGQLNIAKRKAREWDYLFREETQ